MWRLFCNRSPSDSPPNIPADPCPYGLDLATSHHLLCDCPLLVAERTKLLQSTTSNIHILSYITAPQNAPAIRRFLRATGLGHTPHLCINKHHGPATGLDDSDSDSP